MHFIAITLGTILLSINYTSGVNNRLCYIARICIHNGFEKCGMDGKGNVRRFLDTCDILEYDCLYNTDFVKVSMHRCKDLPPISENKEEA